LEGGIFSWKRERVERHATLIVMNLIFKSQPREELTPWRPYTVGRIELEERLTSHRGEFVSMTEPAGHPPRSYPAPSEAVYEWVLQDQRGRQWRYRLPESESSIIGKSTEEIHEFMKSQFAEQLRNDVLTARR
jgi:hypothetical protein